MHKHGIWKLPVLMQKFLITKMAIKWARHSSLKYDKKNFISKQWNDTTTNQGINTTDSSGKWKCRRHKPTQFPSLILNC